MFYVKPAFEGLEPVKESVNICARLTILLTAP
jgi:hypothetical protein